MVVLRCPRQFTARRAAAARRRLQSLRPAAAAPRGRRRLGDVLGNGWLVPAGRSTVESRVGGGGRSPVDAGDEGGGADGSYVLIPFLLPHGRCVSRPNRWVDNRFNCSYSHQRAHLNRGSLHTRAQQRAVATMDRTFLGLLALVALASITLVDAAENASVWNNHVYGFGQAAEQVGQAAVPGHGDLKNA